MFFEFIARVLRTGMAYLERDVLRPLENEVSFFFSRRESLLTFIDAPSRNTARRRGGGARGRLCARQTFGHARPNVPPRFPS